MSQKIGPPEGRVPGLADITPSKLLIRQPCGRSDPIKGTTTELSPDERRNWQILPDILDQIVAAGNVLDERGDLHVRNGRVDGTLITNDLVINNTVNFLGGTLRFLLKFHWMVVTDVTGYPNITAEFSSGLFSVDSTAGGFGGTFANTSKTVFCPNSMFATVAVGDKIVCISTDVYGTTRTQAGTNYTYYMLGWEKGSVGSVVKAWCYIVGGSSVSSVSNGGYVDSFGEILNDGTGGTGNCRIRSTSGIDVVQDGIYSCSFNAVVRPTNTSPSQGTQINLTVYKNRTSSVNIRGDYFWNKDTAGSPAWSDAQNIAGSGLVSLDSGDYLELRNGTSVSVYADVASLSLHRIGDQP